MTDAAGFSFVDPVLAAVLAGRMEGIVREMSHTLQRAARSGVIAVCCDFSCAIVTADNRLLATASPLPAHIFGSNLQTAAMCRIHGDLSEGDAYLDNSVYLGNTHAADHTILIPIFVDDVHLFTVSAKAHQADIGNSVPSTYSATARDVYEEGALIFPCVRIQKDFSFIDDIIRMCRARIRVPDQWYGDLLAMLGAARIGEKRLKELCQRYGTGTIATFIEDWLSYSEERMIQAVRKFPAIRINNTSRHDPVEPFLPDGIPINVDIDIDPEKAMIIVDLRDNVDCVDCGLNLSEACTLGNVLVGIFNCVDPDIPRNAGSLRRVEIRLRDNCVVGRPQFPHSCSLATTNPAERLANAVQSAFAKIGEDYGLAESGFSMGAGMAVISGRDFRRADEPYVNQLFLTLAGGAASPHTDGWVNFCQPSVGGAIYRDSVELVELKHAISVKSLRILQGTGGPGRFRGAPAMEVVLTPKANEVTFVIPSDGHHYPARGARGGGDGIVGATHVVDGQGRESRLPNFVSLVVKPGEAIRGTENSGGGYGRPMERDPERVRADVLEGWETQTRALDVYGVVLTGNVEDETLTVDRPATDQRRLELEKLAGQQEAVSNTQQGQQNDQAGKTLSD